MPSAGTHQGACGPATAVGCTKAAPPSAGATVTSQSIASRTSRSSQASVASMIRSAISTAAGWLAAAGSRARARARTRRRRSGRPPRVPHRPGRAAVEQPLEHPPVEHPRRRGQEPAAAVEVWRLLHGAISAPAARRRLERNGHRREILVTWQDATWSGCRPAPGSLPGTRSGRRPPRCAALVACLWASVARRAPTATTLVLPDACSDLIWEQGVGGYVAGPDTGPVRTVTKAGTVIVGVRFRPVRGRPGARPAAERGPRPARRPRRPAAVGRQAAARDLRPGRGGRAGARHRRPAASPMPPRPRGGAGRGPAARPGRAHRGRRRAGGPERAPVPPPLHAAAGYGPKTLQRVLRFRRFVRTARRRRRAAGPGRRRGRAGYADQAHLTRECSALSGLTPAALARVRASA